MIGLIKDKVWSMMMNLVELPIALVHLRLRIIFDLLFFKIIISVFITFITRKI